MNDRKIMTFPHCEESNLDLSRKSASFMLKSGVELIGIRWIGKWKTSFGRLLLYQEVDLHFTVLPTLWFFKSAKIKIQILWNIQKRQCLRFSTLSKVISHKKVALFTVWKFHDFSVIQILREITFGQSRSSKTAVFRHFVEHWILLIWWNLAFEKEKHS